MEGTPQAQEAKWVMRKCWVYLGIPNGPMKLEYQIREKSEGRDTWEIRLERKIGLLNAKLGRLDFTKVFLARECIIDFSKFIKIIPFFFKERTVGYSKCVYFFKIAFGCTAQHVGS